MEYPMIHICYRVMDLEASEKFYCDAFGFAVSRKKDFPEGRFTLSYLTSAGLPFELELTYNYDQQEPYVIGNGYSHLAVATTDLEASHQRHAEMGLEVTPLKGL
ncbi:MAG: VOC family protein, partial [Desulfofustis sp.]|nr:VOC family protein [Desulfofustis sp.]